MSHSSLRLVLLASAVALGGCTVYVNNRPPPNRQQQAQQTRQQPRTNTRRVTTTRPPVTAATSRTPTTTTPAPAQAADPPRIQGRIPFGNGSIGAFKGYAYVIPATTRVMPDLSKMVPFATLLTDSFIVQPQEFSGGFPGVLAQEEWFAIRYQGAFDVQRDANYIFRLVSDDGAILYIDNEKVADNNGLHGAKEVTATKNLRAGRHQLRLEYFQGKKGTVALSLSMSDNDTMRPLVGVR